MKYVYDNPKIKSRLILCNDLEEEAGMLRSNSLYKIIWVKEGMMKLLVNHEQLVFHGGEIVTLSYLHHVELKEVNGKYGAMLFNSRFYQIVDHDNEVCCNGLLFNGSLNVTSFRITEEDAVKLRRLETVFVEEICMDDAMRDEMLRLILKRALIICCRLARNKLGIQPLRNARFETMRNFYAMVDEHFREKKQVNDYAELLNKSAKTISSVLAYYHQPSPIKVIHNRIIAEAERLLYYTSKSSKEIALLLGFEDPPSFSRFFKTMTGLNATEFRKQAQKPERRAIA
ncbi:MAG: helix-turn-helix domain-containing protein [Tannerella sp.]|jgi:AraC-like DNA-binding protein|nr:helix-turn-helix domain-containing protein [Tannerella sp.]